MEIDLMDDVLEFDDSPVEFAGPESTSNLSPNSEYLISIIQNLQRRSRMGLSAADAESGLQ
jgi:hypothetical protein